MKRLQCPVNGLRDISEFSYGGAVADAPSTDADDALWADYVFMQDNVRGDVLEWWLHTPSGTWLIAERNTVTDTFGRVWLAQEYLAAQRTESLPELSP